MGEKAFTNQPIATADLPRYETVTIKPVDLSYWYVILINVILVTIFIGGAAAFSLFAIVDSNPVVWTVLCVWVGFMIVQLIVRRFAFRKRGYAVRERDVIYRRGVLSTITTIVPFNRIQHVSINEGVISRQLGLAQIQVFTAGGTAANLSISGLPKNEAERVKAYIMGRISQNGSVIVPPTSMRSNDE